ncbi:MAG: hypothetical protein HRT38_09400 [Alteromonadaceae bacterium]|nr:hypothetical protein [Alteromonadaceae bacterium]
MIIKLNKLSLIKLIIKLKITMLLCIGHVGLVQAANNILLPVEVLGANYTVVSRTFDLSSPNNAAALWMQVNNLSYDNKASISINGGAWFSLTNLSVNMQEPEKTFGGIGGEMPNVRFSIAANNFVDGSNTVQFRFNKHDGLSLGYRVVKFNVLDASDNNLLPEQDFDNEDPELWQAPISGATAIANGKALYETAQLIEPGTTNNINAKCMDCHSSKGFDLEYFSYSNGSIIERSKFHGLTQSEGEEIASYIRSLSTPRYGRPWNPPYQPGAELDGKPIEQWAAGAGLDAVLDKDTDMEPYLFPSGTSQLEVNNVVDFTSHLDVTELPIAIQLPDWKSWLPKVHPKDIWPDGYFEGEEANLEYEKIITRLESGNISQMFSNGNIVNFLDEFQFKVKRWIDTGRDGNDTGSADRWRVLSGTVVNNIKPEYAREYGKVNYAKWMAVKYFEMMHEYNLEYLTDTNPDVPLIDPIEGTRQWPNSDRTVFEVAPHFTADNYLNYADQPLVEGKYMSTAWYHLQMLIHAGEYDQVNNGGPMDWAYHFEHISDMTLEGGPREGFRSISSFIKLWQTRSNGYVGNDFHKAWRMRYVHLWWIYSNQQGDQSAMNDLNVNDADLRVKIYNAAIDNWVTEVRKYDLATWPRSSNDWIDLDPMSHVPSAANVDFGSSRLWKSAKQYHADFFYVLIPRLALLGVDQDILASLAAWCEEAWPLGDWTSLLDGSGVPVYSDSAFVSQNVPTEMVSGATVEVSVVMNNDGTETWDAANFKLGSQNVQGNTTWGLNRITMPTNVSPGANQTFTFNITAPTTEGSYNFQWKMLNEGTEWFGALSNNVVIEVTDTLPLPGQVSLLAPADGGSALSTNTDLSWAAGTDASSHEVLFGSDLGNLVSTTQSGTIFDPGTLAYDTTYYWQINEVNDTGTTTGTLWSFTTSVAPAGAASINSPANASTSLSIESALFWTAGSGATSHEVLFGSDPDNLASVTQSGTSFSPGTLLEYTTYYWQINEINEAGTTSGDLWSFTTALPLPGQASSLSPANVSVDVSITTDLSWTAGSNATSHEVLFGTDPGSLATSTQSGTSFNPGTLLNNTTYFWQINESNVAGTTNGTLSNFTTVGQLPGVAAIVSPADGSNDLSTDTILSWTAGSGAVSHQVLFGTDPANLASSIVSGTSFDPGTLNDGTTYYWQINEINSAGTTTGTLWSFSTEEVILLNAATIVSQEPPPTSMTPGQTVTVSITVNNAGTTTWTVADGHKLGSQNAQGNTTWGFNRLALTEDVAPGANHTFNFDVTAPNTAGTYEFQWRMLQENVQWFGDYTSNISVDVTSEPVETILSESYFETDMDGWIDGDGSGALVKRQRYSSRAAEGDYSIKIKDNEGDSSAMTSPTYDISSYDAITLDYQYYPHNQKSGDGYFVQYYDGSTWQTIATYAEGTDFENGQFYPVSLTLNSSSYTFPTDAKFRFESDGAGGGRHIYIDVVIITATTGGSAQ